MKVLSSDDVPRVKKSSTSCLVIISCANKGGPVNLKLIIPIQQVQSSMGWDLITLVIGFDIRGPERSGILSYCKRRFQPYCCSGCFPLDATTQKALNIFVVRPINFTKHYICFSKSATMDVFWAAPPVSRYVVLSRRDICLRSQRGRSDADRAGH